MNNFHGSKCSEACREMQASLARPGFFRQVAAAGTGYGDMPLPTVSLRLDRQGEVEGGAPARL